MHLGTNTSTIRSALKNPTGTAQDVAIPGNVWLHDVSIPDQATRAGAVSVTSSATQARIPIRLAMKDKFLYASTFLQGLLVVDLQRAIAEFQQTDPATFGQAVSTEGQGFATDTGELAQ